ncbi:hypothetical protein ACJ8PQ_24915, partial [Serratia sp. CY74664]|uniref:hypothetical protein n=1 Tax=Serratia sp. CY74664 TaxID=3383676 RepID=UPI003F9F1589
MKVNIVIISLLILSLSSCALFKSPASRHELKPGETYWFDYDSTRSSAIYIPADSNIKYCVAPPPDVAQSVIAALKAEMSTEQIQKVSGVKDLVVPGGVGVVPHLHFFQDRIVGQMHI